MIDTPSMQKYLVEAVGYNIEKERGQQILEDFFEYDYDNRTHSGLEK